MRLEDLNFRRGYWYLASPYTFYPVGQEQAHADICCVAGKLLRRDIPIFSPIAHSHPIAEYADIEPMAHEFWMRANRHLIEGAAGVIVVKLESWDESGGIEDEIKIFRQAKKPVLYLDPITLDISDEP
jgi:hypothetical protein